MARLPKAIERQLAEAEKTQAALAEQAATAEAPRPSIEQTLVASELLKVEAPPVQVPPPAPAPTPAPAPATPEPWEQRYRTLQGQYNAKVPALERQIQEMSEQLKALQAKPAPQPETPAPNPKDVEDFGKDMVEMVHRNVEQQLAHFGRQFAGRLENVEKAVQTLSQGVQATSQTTAYTAEQMFFASLAREVPDYETINADPRFLGWLAEVDRIYGKPRQTALDDAAQNFDAARAAAVFRAFKEAIAPPPAPVAPAPSALEMQVAPNASGGSQLPTPVEKPIFTDKQVNDFYNDVARGRFRGREQEQQRIEAAINLAAAEGRVLTRGR